MSDVNRQNVIYGTFMFIDNGINNITHCMIPNAIDDAKTLERIVVMNYVQNTFTCCWAHYYYYYSPFYNV